MKKISIPLVVIFISISIIYTNCKRDKALRSDSGYPPEIAQIILTKCAVSGCHTTDDKDGAEGIDLSSWQHLFEGDEESEVKCIPYFADESELFYHCNTYADLGSTATPRMPNIGPPLSRAEVQTLYNWIQQGAPDINGNIPFADNPNREKIYITNQGCDRVAVIDAESKLLMRYVLVGNQTGIESPHTIKVSADKKYWYVVFAGGNVIQKFDASSDKFVGEANIGSGNWNAFVISPDGKKAFVVDYSNSGKVAFVDLENMVLKTSYTGSSLFIFPHCIAVSKKFDTLYIATTTGNFLYKMNVSTPMNPDLPVSVALTTGETPNFSSSSNLAIHEIRFAPDYRHYYITCQALNQVRVYQSSNDSMIANISVGGYPQELCFAKSEPYLLVSCMADAACDGSPCLGSVAVINYQTNKLIKTISSDFYQPHGIAVDETRHRAYVCNRNILSSGPPPHHTTSCGGRNGFLNFIDLETLEKDEYRIELSVDSYGMDAR